VTVFSRLIPREERFYDLFSAAADNALETAKALYALMTDFQDPAAASRKVQTLEHRGDEVSHDVANRLATTFVTPFDRDDIHDLAGALDDVVDTIEKVVDMFVLYRIDAPTSVAIQLSSIIVQQCEVIVQAVGKLRRFKDLKQDWVEIRRLESEADRVSREAVAGLFADTADPLTVIKWKDVYALFEETCDRCEDVADIIEQLSAKHS
jgi:predicted phosphate transport protein (TIGR00153 family)